MASIFDIFREEGILKEAEDDTKQVETSAEESPADNNDNSTDDSSGDDDFDIDASLDDEGSGSNTDDSGLGEEDSSPSSSSDISSGSSSDTGDEEVNDDNTDIFVSLTAEEQQIKIKELKRLYQDLYTSCDEVLDRINNLELNEDNLQIITRISYSMYDLKRYISEYLISVFPRKSYIENDIAFNRFLSIVKSIATILEKYQKKTIKDDKL